MIQQIQQTFLALINSLKKNTDTPPVTIIGLSGGPDSVFLLHALAPLHHQKCITIHAVHINHGWRRSAQHDQDFCRQLCAELVIPFSAEQANDWYQHLPTHKQQSGSAEADAREMRRAVFEHYYQLHHATAITLGHHANDQVETFFIRLIRGSGLTGLCGMKPLTDNILRPLLTIYKKDILTWLDTNNLTYCHDETNTSNAFLRNRIRAHITPALEACDSRSAPSLLRTMNHLQQEEAILKEITIQSIGAITENNDWYNTKKFLAHAPALRARIISSLLISHQLSIAISEALLIEVERFLTSPRGGTHKIGVAGEVIKKQKLFTLKTPHHLERKN